MSPSWRGAQADLEKQAVKQPAERLTITASWTHAPDPVAYSEVILARDALGGG